MASFLFVVDLVALTVAARRCAGPRSAFGTRRDHALAVAALAVFTLLFVLTSLGALMLLRAPMVSGVLVVCAFGTYLATRKQFRAPPEGQAPDEAAEAPAHWLAFMPVAIPVLAAMPYVLRAIAAPPRAWDALTYHLVRGALWTADGGFVSHPAPDAWRYYDFFPHAGDLAYAFAFLSGHGDALLYLIYGATFALVLLGAFVFARAAGAPVFEASLSVAAVGTLPCVLHQVASAYGDDISLALAMVTVAFATLAVRANDADRPLSLALLSAGLGIAVKTAALPVYLAVAGLAVVLVARRRANAGRQIVAAAIGLVPACLWLFHTFAETGSLTYPFALPFEHLQWARGNELLARTLDGTLPGSGAHVDSLASFFSALFVGPPWAAGPPLHFGIGAAVALAFATLVPLWNRRLPRAFFVFLLPVVLIPALGILSPATVMLRTEWGFISARLIAASVAIPICLAATLPRRLARVVLGLCLLLALPTMPPLGLPTGDLTSHAVAIVLGLLFAAGLILPFATPTRMAKASSVTAVVLLSPFLLGRLDMERDAARHDFYASLEGETSFDLHGIGAGDSDVAWRFFDDGRPHTIAYSAGFDPPGHNWFRYPLFGGRFQNRVVYVPATKTGEVVDTWRGPTPDDPPLDADAYARRLAAESVTEILFAMPAPPELSIVRARPDLFEPLVSPMGQSFVVYRLTPKP